MTYDFILGDCVNIPLGDKSVDLVFGSPPYEDARDYGIGFNKVGDEWVEWCLPRIKECLRVSRSLVAWVVAGRTRNYEYSATPERLVAALSNQDWCSVRQSVIYKRMGIPGTGGPDWFRVDHEYVVCVSRPGRLHWSDNTACGKPPVVKGDRRATNRNADGTRKNVVYKDPKLTNPGSIVDCGNAGSSLGTGAKYAKQTDAPFPESLAERFVLSFCPPGGVVLDPFSGSGTTAAVAARHGRSAFGMDIRESQIELSRQRVGFELTPLTHRSNNDVNDESGLFKS